MFGVAKKNKAKGNTVYDYDRIFDYINFHYINIRNCDVYSIFGALKTGNYSKQSKTYGTDGGEFGRLFSQYAADL